MALGIAACGDGRQPAESSQPKAAGGPLSVYVVNYPLQYFAEGIGADSVHVAFPAPPGVDPAFWLPEAETVGAYQQADLILLNGATYAKWVDRVTLPDSKLVDTSKSFEDRYITVEGEVTHSHGPQGEHSHAGTAFTTWLDPTLAIEQARAIQQAFTSLRPGQAEVFQQRFDALQADLQSLDQQLQTLVAHNPKQPLLASHPVYQYLVRRYGLNLQSVLWEPEEIPSDPMWNELERLNKNHHARWMLWEAAPVAEIGQRLEKMGISSFVYSPAGNVPAEGDFLSVMRQNAKNLGRAFAP